MAPAPAPAPGNGAGGFASGAPTRLFDPVRVALGDFNGDRKLDVAVADYDRTWVLLGDGAGGFAPGAGFAIGLPAADVAVGALDGDQRPVVVLLRRDAAISVLLNRSR